MATTVVRAASTNVHKWNLTTRREVGASSLFQHGAQSRRRNAFAVAACFWTFIINSPLPTLKLRLRLRLPAQAPVGQQKQMLPPGCIQDTTFYLACSGTAHCIVQLKCNGCWAAPWTLYINRIWQPGSIAPTPIPRSLLSFIFPRFFAQLSCLHFNAGSSGSGWTILSCRWLS